MAIRLTLIAIPQLAIQASLYFGATLISGLFTPEMQGDFSACGGVIMLATGADCPVQMYRVGEHVYVTQFHPELDADDLAARMRIYQHAG